MMSRRAFLAALPALAAGCRGDFSLLGYTTKPPFDTGIRTVHVPVFKSQMLQTTPYRDLEVDVTSAVVKEINTRTPWRVTSNREGADTELLGVLVRLDKTIMNRTPQNFARELEYAMTCTVVWRDLRTGKILSNRSQAPRLLANPPPFDPTLPPPPPEECDQKAVPAVVVATARAIPELGESTTTGMKAICDSMARNIVNMMETPW